MTAVQPDDKLVAVKDIVTENGKCMLALERVQAPFRPADPTHLGPAGDYWKIVPNDEAHMATCHIWLGAEWQQADELFIRGLMHVGITFDSVCEMPPISADLMLVDQMLRTILREA